MDHYIRAKKVELIHSGEEYFKVNLDLIHSAKESIHLQTYILAEDNTGVEVADALITAAKRGVKIWMLIDGYGSKELSKSFINKLKEAGIQFRFFGPFFSSESVSKIRRLHHKILVVDKKQMLIGGINIGDRYRGTPKEKAWLDYAVLIDGACGEMIHHLCEMMYDKKNDRWTVNFKRDESGPLIRFRRNDWVRRKQEVYRGYKQAVIKSTKSITIVGCYFMPGFRFLHLMKRAVQRGVKVRVMMGSVSDIPMFHNAEKYLYDYLLRNGMEIYEWNDSVLHGKAACVDNKWVTVGSYNLNNLSKYKTIELNVDIKDEAFARNFEAEIEDIFKNKCTHVIPGEYQKKTHIFSRIKNGFAYYYYRLFMLLVSSRE